MVLEMNRQMAIENEQSLAAWNVPSYLWDSGARASVCEEA